MSRSMSEILSQLMPPDDIAPPNFTHLLRTCNRILDEHGRVTRRTAEPLELLNAFRRRVDDNDDWAGVPLSLVLEVGEHAFAPEFREEPSFDTVRTFFINEIPASDRLGFLAAMTRIYIETFDAAASHTRALAQVLRRVTDKIGAQWTALLQAFPSLFDPSKIVGDVAQKMVELPYIWTGLRDLGLRQPHAPGLMTAAHLEFLVRMDKRLTERSEIERVIAWLRPPGGDAMATGAADAVAALLQPWRGKGISDELKKYLIDSLLDLYGHPKVRRNAVWNQVPQDLEAMFLHWLSGASIRMLFSVLTEVERGHMWADRENYWWSLYEKGQIDEVWVAFNRDGYRVAQSRLPQEQRNSASNFTFALQEGERDKSLLIMRIGDKIVVEGTYNFKVHIFDNNDQNAPQLYLRKYDVANVRWRGRRNARTIPHLGYWQGTVSVALNG
jgi:hypothetical protein